MCDILQLEAEAGVFNDIIDGKQWYRFIPALIRAQRMIALYNNYEPDVMLPNYTIFPSSSGGLRSMSIDTNGLERLINSYQGNFKIPYLKACQSYTNRSKSLRWNACFKLSKLGKPHKRFAFHVHTNGHSISFQIRAKINRATKKPSFGYLVKNRKLFSIPEYNQSEISKVRENFGANKYKFIMGIDVGAKCPWAIVRAEPASDMRETNILISAKKVS